MTKMSMELDRARQLIKEGQFQEAERLLQRLDDPTARQWLQKVRSKISPQQEDSPTSPPKPKNPVDIIVTTTDIHQPYDILGPVYFQVSNKGIFSSALGKLKKQYQDDINQMKKSGRMSQRTTDWGFLYGEWSVGQSDFEVAFYVAVRELQKRAAMMGADAIVGMRQDIDMDTNAFQFFYLQMYGTAIRYT